jgi:hypothetical protein
MKTKDEVFKEQSILRDSLVGKVLTEVEVDTILNKMEICKIAIEGFMYEELVTEIQERKVIPLFKANNNE